MNTRRNTKLAATTLICGLIFCPTGIALAFALGKQEFLIFMLPLLLVFITPLLLIWTLYLLRGPNKTSGQLAMFILAIVLLPIVSFIALVIALALKDILSGKIF